MSEEKKRPTFFVVNACLASVVLCYVLDLSSPGRTLVDFVVIGLVLAAICWNLFQVSRRLYPEHGAKGVWHVQRTVLFWIIGLLNTVFLRPEDVGTWKNWIGWVVLGLAVFDTVALFLKERGITKRSASLP